MTQPTYPNQSDKNQNMDKKDAQRSSRDEEGKRKEDEYSRDKEGKRKEQLQNQGHTPGFHKSQNPSTGKEQSGRDSENESQQNKGQDNTKYRP